MTNVWRVELKRFYWLDPWLLTGLIDTFILPTWSNRHFFKYDGCLDQCFPVETLWCRENLAGTALLHNQETRVQRLTLLRWKRIIRWMQRLLVWLTYSQSFDRWRIRKKFDRLIKYQKVSVALVITRLMFSRKIWWVKNSNNIGQDFIRRRFNQFAEKFNRMKSKIYGVWNRIAHKASARKYMVRVWFFLSKQPCAQNKFYNSGLGARLVA